MEPTEHDGKEEDERKSRDSREKRETEGESKRMRRSSRVASLSDWIPCAANRFLPFF